MSDVLLAARNVSKSYTLGPRSLEVLRGVNLEVARGEFLALRGASGAGKSTLLHLFGGLDAPNTGEIWFAGQNLARASATELTRLRNRRVGFIFQSYHLLPELDALENVCVPARLARVPAATAARRGRELLEQVGLGARLDHKPYELSGGEQQRVAIARAIAKRPEVLLCDEPTGALDVTTGITVLEAIERINRELGTLTVVITHNAAMAAMADRVLHLSDGKIVREEHNAVRLPARELKW
jgi:ABC-type lipoprotein export system ATPase subunit